MEWTGFIQSYKKFKESNFINSFCVPVHSLVEFFEIKPEEIATISVLVSVWEKTNLSQDHRAHEEVHIFEHGFRQNVQRGK